MKRLLSMLLFAVFSWGWPPTALAQCGALDARCCAPGNKCLPGFQCNSGKCKRADPPANPICGVLNSACCSGDSCGPGLGCDGGRCTKSAPSQVQPPCGAVQQGCCAGDRACGPGLTCKKRGNVDACLVPSDGPCLANANCAPGTVCRGGICSSAGHGGGGAGSGSFAARASDQERHRPASAAASISVPAPIACSVRALCPDSLVCQFEICRQPMPVKQCSSDYDCDFANKWTCTRTPHTASSGICEYQGGIFQICPTDGTPCNSGGQCQNNRCEAAGQRNQACRLPGPAMGMPCEWGLRCDFGVCR
jgi:hypothetical protein